MEKRQSTNEIGVYHKPVKVHPKRFTTTSPSVWQTCDIRKEADHLIDWAIHSDALTIQQFCTDRTISMKIINSFRKKSLYFSDAYDFALDIIGARREGKSLKREIDSKREGQFSGYYNKEYKTYLQEMREERQKSEDHIDKSDLEQKDESDEQREEPSSGSETEIEQPIQDSE